MGRSWVCLLKLVICCIGERLTLFQYDMFLSSTALGSRILDVHSDRAVQWLFIAFQNRDRYRSSRYPSRMTSNYNR